MAAQLKSSLRGSACRAFVAGMKLAIGAADAFRYPDVFVTCDPRDRGAEGERAKRHPALVVEVLSDSTPLPTTAAASSSATSRSTRSRSTS